MNVVRGDETEGGEGEGGEKGGGERGADGGEREEDKSEARARGLPEPLCARAVQEQLFASRLQERLLDLLGAFALCLPLSLSQYI